MLRTKEHLEAFLKYMGWRQYDADRYAGVKLGRTASYLRANRPAQPTEEYLNNLVKASGLPAKNWKELAIPGFGNAPPPGFDPPSPLGSREMVARAGRRMFPLVGTAGAAAAPLESTEADPDAFVEFSEDLYRADRFAIQIKGDSMEPRIKHGSFVLVQPHANPMPGLLVVVKNGNHEHIVKLLRPNGDLEPINPDYPVIKPTEGFEIVGYAVGIRHERGPRSYMEEGDDAGLRP